MLCSPSQDELLGSLSLNQAPQQTRISPFGGHTEHQVIFFLVPLSHILSWCHGGTCQLCHESRGSPGAIAPRTSWDSRFLFAEQTLSCLQHQRMFGACSSWNVTSVVAQERGRRQVHVQMCTGSVGVWIADSFRPQPRSHWNSQVSVDLTMLQTPKIQQMQLLSLIIPKPAGTRLLNNQGGCHP